MKNTETAAMLDQLIDGLEATIGAGLELRGGSAPGVSLGPRCQTDEFCTEFSCTCYVD
jgi:hypothetical protein